MTTYRIRNLHCIQCDQPVRARNEIIDGVEHESPCPDCGGVLSDVQLRFDVDAISTDAAFGRLDDVQALVLSEINSVAYLSAKDVVEWAKSLPHVHDAQIVDRRLRIRLKPVASLINVEIRKIGE